ncbi:MAG: hypothetical protein ABSE41_17430 [Bacteroidota bacterium]|jgi:hypothetical protein
MMKNDNTQANHRGSSPPFQDPEHDFYDWLKELVSIDVRDEKASVIQIARRPGNEKAALDDLNDGGSHQGRDDESRWRDVGGNNGKAV